MPHDTCKQFLSLIADNWDRVIAHFVCWTSFVNLHFVWKSFFLQTGQRVLLRIYVSYNILLSNYYKHLLFSALFPIIFNWFMGLFLEHFVLTAEKAKRRNPADHAGIACPSMKSVSVHTFVGLHLATHIQHSSPSKAWQIVADASQNLHCQRGSACKFAHNAFEYWLHPTRYVET